MPSISVSASRFDLFLLTPRFSEVIWRTRGMTNRFSGFLEGDETAEAVGKNVLAAITQLKQGVNEI